MFVVSKISMFQCAGMSHSWYAHAMPMSQSVTRVQASQPDRFAQSDICEALATGPPDECNFGHGSSPPLRAAVVNEAPYHMEILFGYVYLFSNWNANLTVYVPGQSKRTARQTGDMFGITHPYEIRDSLGLSKSNIKPVDIVVFITPEKHPWYLGFFMRQSKPTTAIAIIHDGHKAGAHWVKNYATMFPGTLSFAALSPHVVDFCKSLAPDVQFNFLLPVPAFLGQCSSGNSSEALQWGKQHDEGFCNEGFCIQGNFHSYRRNYGMVWSFMKRQIWTAYDKKNSSSDDSDPIYSGYAPFKLHILGRGSTRSLGRPDSLSDAVLIHNGLSYPRYYDRINRCRALVPAFRGDKYFRHKFSSTIVTSIITGTPVISTPKLLAAYSFLPANATFVPPPSDNELTALPQLAKKQAQRHIEGARMNLEQTREDVNHQSGQTMCQLMHSNCRNAHTHRRHQ